MTTQKNTTEKTPAQKMASYLNLSDMVWAKNRTVGEAKRKCPRLYARMEAAFIDWKNSEASN